MTRHSAGMTKHFHGMPLAGRVAVGVVLAWTAWIVFGFAFGALR